MQSKNNMIGKKFTFKNEDEILKITKVKPSYFYYEDTKENEYTMKIYEFNTQFTDGEIILAG